MPVTRKQVISAPEQANNPVSKWGDGQSAHTPPVWWQLPAHCTAGMHPSYAGDGGGGGGMAARLKSTREQMNASDESPKKEGELSGVVGVFLIFFYHRQHCTKLSS